MDAKGIQALIHKEIFMHLMKFDDPQEDHQTWGQQSSLLVKVSSQLTELAADNLNVRLCLLILLFLVFHRYTFDNHLEML